MKHPLSHPVAALLAALALSLVGGCSNNDNTDTPERHRIDLERQQQQAAEKSATPDETATRNADATPAETTGPETKAQVVEQAHPEHHHAMGAIPSSEGDWDDILIFTGGDDGFPTLEKDRQRAEQGDVDSQFNLGLTYEGKGHPGVEPDNAQAVFWYEKAIEKRKGAPQSDAQRAAQRNLTRLYENMEKERRNLIRLREEMERENNQKSGETGATPLPPAPETKTPEKRADAPTPAAQEADAAFGFQALGQLAAAQKSGGNLLIGPRNIRTALAAVAVGAVGQTRDEILAQTGDYDSIDNASGKSFTNALHIWVPTGKQLQPQFSGHFPDARVESTTPAKAPGIINAYVNQQTKGKIRKILEDPPSEDGMVLTTVLDFEGKWLIPFKPEYTSVETFFITPDKHQKTHLMSTTRYFNYAATEDGQMVQLPYRDDDLVMTIFLPRPELKLEDWLAKQGRGKDWQAAVSAMKDREGNVKLPRVKFDFSAGLEKTLQTLGIQRAFTDDAQFDGILQNSDPLKIDFVIHKTHIDIDEQGTKAAAATSIVMRAATAANPNAKKEEPFYMRIDRPFFLTIGDAKNRKILFMGIVRQPDRAK